MRKNKKGFLLAEQTVKIIIALLVLGCLIFLLTSLYYSKVRIEKQKQAEAELKSGGNPLEKVIESIKEGQTGTFMLKTPSGWYLFSYTKPAQKGQQPAKCGLRPCLCICENVWDYASRQIKYCQNYGVCINVPELMILPKELEIEINPSKPPVLNIERSGGVVNIF